MANATKKSGSTRVETSRLVKTAETLGLTVEAKAGWLLIYPAGNRKQRLLVHTGKKGTNCIELVSFESEYAVAHPCPPAKTMTQMIDCNVEKKLIERNFYKVAKALAALAPKAEKPAEEAAPAASTEAPAEQVAEPVAQVA